MRTELLFPVMCVFIGLGPMFARPLGAQTAPPSEANQEVQSEPDSGRPGFTLELGLGIGSNGLGGVLAVAFPHRKGVFLLRSAGSEDFDFLSASTGYSDVAFLFGRLGQMGHGWTRVALGPAVAWKIQERGCLESSFIWCTRWDRVTRVAPGLAIQADAVWAVVGPLGLGLSLFGDLNTAGSFGGALVTLHLGRIR